MLLQLAGPNELAEQAEAVRYADKQLREPNKTDGELTHPAREVTDAAAELDIAVSRFIKLAKTHTGI